MVELESEMTADTTHKARHSLEGSENGEFPRQLKAQRSLCRDRESDSKFCSSLRQWQLWRWTEWCLLWWWCWWGTKRVIRIANVLELWKSAASAQTSFLYCSESFRYRFFPSTKHSEKLTWENAKLFLSSGNKPLIHRGNQILVLDLVGWTVKENKLNFTYWDLLIMLNQFVMNLGWVHLKLNFD